MPFEIITMLASSLLSGVLTIWSQSLKSKQMQQEMLLARAGFAAQAVKDARTYSNKGFQFTRRIIALTAVAMVIVYPKLAALYYDVPVIMMWTEMTSGFWPFVEAKEIMLDKELFGIVITPLDTHLVSAIIGLYFGGSLVRR